MTISLIVAMDENRLIGRENKLPWDLPSEWNYFMERTKDKPRIMGRKTYESTGMSMPESLNIIMTRNKNYKAGDCIVVNNIEDAIKAAKDSNEIMVIGGAEIYRLFLPIADRLYISTIHGTFKGDTYFPGFNENEWVELEEKLFEKDSENKHSHTRAVLLKCDSKIIGCLSDIVVKSI